MVTSQLELSATSGATPSRVPSARGDWGVGATGGVSGKWGILRKKALAIAVAWLGLTSGVWAADGVASFPRVRLGVTADGSVVVAGGEMQTWTNLAPIGSLRVVTDSNGALTTFATANSGVQGPLTPLSNAMGRTDSNGALNITVNGGTITPSVIQASSGSCTAGAVPYSFSGDTDTGVANTGANTLDFCAGGTSRLSVGASAISAGVPYNNGAALSFQWNGRSALFSPADGLVQMLNTGSTGFTRLILGTNDGTANGASLGLSTGRVVFKTGDGSTADAQVQGIYVSTGSGLAVANVGANSCGTSAATIAGGNNSFVITVGATSGTQCRVTFTFAATTQWDCTVTDSTTTIATRATPVDTTHTDFFGAFVAGDKVTGHCFPR